MSTAICTYRTRRQLAASPPRSGALARVGSPPSSLLRRAVTDTAPAPERGTFELRSMRSVAVIVQSRKGASVRPRGRSGAPSILVRWNAVGGSCARQRYESFLLMYPEIIDRMLSHQRQHLGSGAPRLSVRSSDVSAPTCRGACRHLAAIHAVPPLDTIERGCRGSGDDTIGLVGGRRGDVFGRAVDDANDLHVRDRTGCSRPRSALRGIEEEADGGVDAPSGVPRSCEGKNAARHRRWAAMHQRQRKQAEPSTLSSHDAPGGAPRLGRTSGT